MCRGFDDLTMVASITVWQVRPPTDIDLVTSCLTTDEAAWVESPHLVIRAATRAVLRSVVAGHLGVAARGVQFDRRCSHCDDPVHGKPSVVGSDLEITVSHTVGLGLVAVSVGNRLGVDVERAERPRGDERRRLHERVLHPAERELVEALPLEAQAEAFLRLWSAKEAVAKADGRGIALRLRDLDVGGLLSGRVQDVPVGEDRWSVQALALPDDHVGALASTSRVDVDLRSWVW